MSDVKRWTVKKDEQGMYLDNGLDVYDPPVGTVLLEPADPLSAAGMRDEIARLAGELADKGGDYQRLLDYATTLRAELAEAKRAYENATAQRAAINAERDALKAQVAELELLTTRDDYEALERQVAGLKSEIDFLDGELKRLTAELAEARSEVMEQARCNGMGAERELKLITERDALRAALEQVRETTPVRRGTWHDVANRCHEIARVALAGPTRTAEQPAVLLTDEDHLYRWEVTPFPYGKKFDVYVTDDDHEALEAAKDALEQAWDTTEPGNEFTVRVKFNGPDRNAVPTTAEGTEK